MSTPSPSSTLTAACPLLPPSVEQIIQRICAEQHQSPPDTKVRRQLDQIGEEASLDILRTISTQKIKVSLSGYIFHMIKQARGGGQGSTPGNLPPSKRSAASVISPGSAGSPSKH